MDTPPTTATVMRHEITLIALGIAGTGDRPWPEVLRQASQHWAELRRQWYDYLALHAGASLSFDAFVAMRVYGSGED